MQRSLCSRLVQRNSSRLLLLLRQHILLHRRGVLLFLLRRQLLLLLHSIRPVARVETKRQSGFWDKKQRRDMSPKKFGNLGTFSSDKSPIAMAYKTHPAWTLNEGDDQNSKGYLDVFTEAKSLPATPTSGQDDHSQSGHSYSRSSSVTSASFNSPSSATSTNSTACRSRLRNRSSNVSTDGCNGSKSIPIHDSSTSTSPYASTTSRSTRFHTTINARPISTT